MRDVGAGRPTVGLLRTARAGALAVTVVTIAAAAHVLGGGGPPGPLAASGGAALVFAIASLLARRRLRLPVIVAFLAAGQLLLHGTFMVGAAGHAMDGTGAALLDSLSPPMLAAHTVATAISAVLLQRGEAALWVVWAFVSRRLSPVLRPYLVLPGAAPVLLPVRVTRTRVPLLHDADRRGPPRRA